VHVLRAGYATDYEVVMAPATHGLTNTYLNLT
jgi:hypothetical protein